VYNYGVGGLIHAVVIVDSLAYRIVRDASLAKEVTQETFVRLWRNATSFDPTKGKISVWLLRITHNLSLNEVRRRQSRPVLVTPPEEDGVAITEQFIDQGDDPSDVVWLRERSVAIRHAMEQLPSQQRQAIELAFFGGLSQSEIAAHLAEPLGTVKGRIRLGMQRLRKLLADVGIDATAIEAQR